MEEKILKYTLLLIWCAFNTFMFKWLGFELCVVILLGLIYLEIPRKK